MSQTRRRRQARKRERRRDARIAAWAVAVGRFTARLFTLNPAPFPGPLGQLPGRRR